MTKAISIVCLFLVIVILLGCRLGIILSKSEKVNEWTVNYHLFYNNRTNTHVPAALGADAFTANSPRNSYKRYIYQFNLSENVVTKRTGFSKKSISYVLVHGTDSTAIPKLSTGLSELDLIIFKRITQLSDSLHLKDFSELLKAKGFSIKTN